MVLEYNLINGKQQPTINQVKDLIEEQKNSPENIWQHYINLDFVDLRLLETDKKLTEKEVNLLLEIKDKNYKAKICHYSYPNGVGNNCSAVKSISVEYHDIPGHQQNDIVITTDYYIYVIDLNNENTVSYRVKSDPNEVDLLASGSDIIRYNGIQTAVTANAYSRIAYAAISNTTLTQKATWADSTSYSSFQLHTYSDSNNIYLWGFLGNKIYIFTISKTSTTVNNQTVYPLSFTTKDNSLLIESTE